MLDVDALDRAIELGAETLACRAVFSLDAGCCGAEALRLGAAAGGLTAPEALSVDGVPVDALWHATKSTTANSESIPVQAIRKSISKYYRCCFNYNHVRWQAVSPIRSQNYYEIGLLSGSGIKCDT